MEISRADMEARGWEQLDFVVDVYKRQKPGPSVRIQQCAARDNGGLPFPLTGAQIPPIQPESSERIFPRTPCTALHHPAALCSILSGYSFSS